MKVLCVIEEVDDIEDEDGDVGDGVRATCGECDHQTESYGTGPRSVSRCLALMREECPNGGRNFYVDEAS
jgi:hypothetical protein